MRRKFNLEGGVKQDRNNRKAIAILQSLRWILHSVCVNVGPTSAPSCAAEPLPTGQVRPFGIFFSVCFGFPFHFVRHHQGLPMASTIADILMTNALQARGDGETASATESK